MKLEDLIKLMASQIQDEADIDPVAAIEKHKDTILAIEQLNLLHTIALVLNRKDST